MTVVNFQSSRTSKGAFAGSADRNAPPAAHADTDAAAGGERAAAKRVRVERGIYRQPNGKYAVCFMLNGRPLFRTVGYDLELARQQRETLARAASYGVLACAPRLSFAKLAGWWLERYERKVKTGQRRERTLALHRYHLKRNLLPSLAPKLARAITAQDIAELIERLREDGRSERTIANALHTLNSIMRFAIRSDWIAENPLEKLERQERPHPVRCMPRVLGQQEIAALLGACTPAARTLIATALYTGLRISELLGLTWSDIDLGEGTLRVHAQLSLASRGKPARRVAPKTSAASRQIPLPPAPPRAQELRRVRQDKRLGVRNKQRHATQPTKRSPLARRDGPPPGTGPEHIAPTFPRPAPHLRQSLDHRRRPRRGASEPATRTRESRHHATRLRAHVRLRPPRR